MPTVAFPSNKTFALRDEVADQMVADGRARRVLITDDDGEHHGYQATGGAVFSRSLVVPSAKKTKDGADAKKAAEAADAARAAGAARLAELAGKASLTQAETSEAVLLLLKGL